MRRYLAEVKKGSLKYVSELIAEQINKDDIGKNTLSFRSGSSKDKVKEITNELLHIFSASYLRRKGTEKLTEEQELIKLGEEFIQAGRSGDLDKVQNFIDFDFPVNFQEPTYKQTLLHISAGQKGSGSIKLAKLLISSGKCDYLIRDIYNKIAVDNAMISGESEIVALLDTETREAAKKAGIDYYKDRIQAHITFALKR